MRPLELTVEGFRSYREPATFDWRERRLVGIVGPIGSGKSSILDAVSFALFGKTPNIEQNTKSLIHQMRDQCHVDLRFEVDAQVWRAVRALRRKGQPGHLLERLVADEPEAKALETITGERAVNERVTQLLGMDFRAFCRSVLLAQNRFSEFLRATPADRDKVLKSVFGYERLDTAQALAKERLRLAEVELEVYGKQRQRVAEAREALQEALAVAAAACAREEQLRAAAGEIERLDKEREAASADAEESTARIAMLIDVTGTLPSQDDVDQILVAAAESADKVARAKAALEAAESAQASRRAELADLATRLGDRQRFRSFERLVRQHESEAAAMSNARQTFEHRDRESVEALTRSAERVNAAADAATALSKGDEALARAADRVTQTRAALLQARHAEMALDLRATLTAGDPCPVCEQPVHTLPKSAASPKVGASEKALVSAEKAEAKARSSREALAAAEAGASAGLVDAEAAVAKAIADREQAELELGAAETALAATKGQLVDRLGQGDPRLLLEAREAELTATESALYEAKKAVESARSEFDLATDAERAAASGPAGLANRLAGIWGRLGRDREVSTESSAMRAAFDEVRQTIVAGHEEAQAALEAAGGRATEADRAMGALREAIGLAAGQDFRTTMVEAEVRHATATARVRDLEDEIARSKDLESDLLAAQARRSIAERLAEDLKPSRFLAFLLEEERAELAELGSMHFELLTDGGFRFAADDSFDVGDLNAAGSIRKSDSLSGGETFLASLALALALAQMVARAGGRLDAFFLDEGFGSLDPDHLDRAMDGIGRLVAQDDRRLVVLVSHVAEMREAVEDLIVLDKDGATGDSIVRSGASFRV